MYSAGVGVSFVDQDCQADSENMQETPTLVQPSTTPPLNSAKRKTNALCFPPGRKTGWKASNMMKYCVEKMVWTEEALGTKAARPKRSEGCLPHPLPAWTPFLQDWRFSWTTMNTTAAPPAAGKLQDMENKSFGQSCHVPTGRDTPNLRVLQRN